MFLNPVNREKHPAFVIFPQCPPEGYWTFSGRPESFLDMPEEEGLTPVLATLKEMLDSYIDNPSVDRSRIYIMGQSMGGMATYDLVARFPEIFAAAIPICGAVKSGRLTKVKDVKFRIYHGDADNVVPVECSRMAYRDLRKAGADVELVARGIGMDRRISSHFLNAGLGYGGSCFPKDVKGFINVSEQLGAPMEILKEVERVNTAQLERFLGRIRKKLWVLRNKKIAVWGMAFKQNTDDVRESVAIKLIKRLCEEGACVSAYDPKASETGARALAGYDVTICDDMYECARGAEVLVVATEWKQFATANLVKVRELMRLPIMFDGRNIMHAENAVHAGFEYHSVGRKTLGRTNLRG